LNLFKDFAAYLELLPKYRKRFRRLGAMSFRGAAGAFVLFKLTDRTTFERLQPWFDEVDRLAVKECCKVLVGTCSDLPEDQHQVSYQEAKKFAEDHGVKYIEVSSLNGENVVEAVNLMVDLIMADADRYIVTQPVNNAAPQRTGWCSLI
jgi:GTPase SAR1 family protein